MTTYSRTDSGDETILRIEGTLDAATAPDLRGVVDAIVDEGRMLITLELSGLCEQRPGHYFLRRT